MKRWSFALAICLVAPLAHAFPDPPPPPLPPPPLPPFSTSAPENPPPPTIAPAPPTARKPRRFAPPSTDGAEEARYSDANADRVILTSTAETHPSGTFFFSDYDLIFGQLGYAFTDSFQLALSGNPPLLKNQAYFLDLSAKVNVLRSEWFRAAFIGALDTIVDSHHADSMAGVRLGGVGQLCFDGSTCHHSLSLNAHAILNNHSNQVVPAILGAGLTVRVSPLVKINLEPMYVATLGRGQFVGTTGFFSANYGVRLSRKQWGVDLSFVRPFSASTKDVTDTLFLGVPWVSFTYRTR